MRVLLTIADGVPCAANRQVARTLRIHDGIAVHSRPVGRGQSNLTENPRKGSGAARAERTPPRAGKSRKLFSLKLALVAPYW
jgi:hypothetical protein